VGGRKRIQELCIYARQIQTQEKIMMDVFSEPTRRDLLATSVAAALNLSLFVEPKAAEAAARMPTPQGLGSVSGAPYLPPGFRDTFKSRFVDANGVRLHIVIGGEGPPLLLVHGWPQTGTNGVS
jgi:hypothetical protein